jgi:predicted RNA binding protein with dsRBD fold (UPF0201 family)
LLKLRVEAKINPTESRDKVEEAVKRIFPALQLELREDSLVGESSQPKVLENLHQQLQLQAIRNSARKVLRAGREDDALRFMLNKQAATVSKVSFTDGESPLGPIVVTIQASDPDLVVDYLAPRIREGKLIKKMKLEELG